MHKLIKWIYKPIKWTHKPSKWTHKPSKWTHKPSKWTHRPSKWTHKPSKWIHAYHIMKYQQLSKHNDISPSLHCWTDRVLLNYIELTYL